MWFTAELPEGLSRALNELSRALATSEGRQREFLMSVSHELRTPTHHDSDAALPGGRGRVASGATGGAGVGVPGSGADPGGGGRTGGERAAGRTVRRPDRARGRQRSRPGPGV